MASNSADPSSADDQDYQVQYDDDEEEDDERTIEEEEQLDDDEEQNELDDLEAGANMPLEELLKLYGQNASTINRAHSSDHDQSTNSSVEDDDRPPPPAGFHHLLQMNGQLLPEEDDDDDDETDDSFEPEIVKSINVGDEYQAQIESQTQFDSHTDVQEVPTDELLWSPTPAMECENERIDEYLKTIRSEYPSMDDEIALQILLHCQMKTELALVKFRQLPVKTIYSYREWLPDEIQRFEEGLREYGKDFFKITIEKCTNRTVREVIHYYYQWKKTDRYQSFIEEQQRLNAITSVTDMIERLIEEQEQQLCTAVGVINSTNTSSTSTTVISNELKINSTISFVPAMKRSFDQVDQDVESSTSSKKSSLNTNNNSPTSTTTIV